MQCDWNKDERFGPRCAADAAGPVRTGWRFGNEAKGEEVIVDVEFHYCDEHLDLADDIADEAAAEARGS